VSAIETELSTCKREIDVYENGIAVQRARLRDLSTASERREREETKSLKKEIEDLQLQISNVEQSTARAERLNVEELERFRKKRDETFDDLNEQVLF
jgi:predicted  nucleic acid-binding Zn-ribbon protein